VRVIGMMSGTSFDGIDAAAADLELDGDRIVLRLLGGVSAPYPHELRARIAAALPPAATTFEEVCRLDTAIGQAFADVAAAANAQLCAGRADLVVAHGQTVFHWVADGAVRGTLQLGQPAWIAERTGCAVVADLRSRDVAAGGQGAPLVSAVDVLWLRGRPGVPVALNLGGIANVTVAPPGTHAIGFDTGPANALLDIAVSDRTGGRLTCDVDGAMAARGRVDGALLERFLAEPYYARDPPKTTGKELFHRGYLGRALAGLPPVADDDLAATLTALSARTVGDAVRCVAGTEVIARARLGRAGPARGVEGGLRLRAPGLLHGARHPRHRGELYGGPAPERARGGAPRPVRVPVAAAARADAPAARDRAGPMTGCAEATRRR
jgi:anhydro-N-acetylmuramic acid kinase